MPSGRINSFSWKWAWRRSRDHGHAPFGKIIWALTRISPEEPCTKFEVSSSSFFGDMFDRRPMPKILGVTWLRPRLFWKSYLCTRSAFPRRSCVPNLKSLTQTFLKICFIVSQNRLGVMWPRSRPFWGKLFERPLAFPHTKQCTELEVSSSSSFEDMFDRMLKILGVIWPWPRPFWAIIFHNPLCFY